MCSTDKPCMWPYLLILMLLCMYIMACGSSSKVVGNSNAWFDEKEQLEGGGGVGHNVDEEQAVYSGYGNTIPAAPVQSQVNSCSLDLSDQLLGGVKAACMVGSLDRRHCCPVLAAWLMAARAKVTLTPPLPQQPGMPLLPDDSLVCIASLKAALSARGITLAAPNPTCDVVTCFCGIKLNHITTQSCPLPFSSNLDNHRIITPVSQPTSPNPIINVSSKLVPVHVPSAYKHLPSQLTYDPTINASKGLPFQPSQPASNDSNIVPSIPPTSNASHGLSDLLQLLAANCSDHSYRGCTRCLRTLKKEVSSGSAKGLGVSNSTVKSMDCELIGLMWLLEINKTFYIPTVSAVVRALLYSDHPAKTPRCSPDADNMPLALDYSEILSESIACKTNLPLILIPMLVISYFFGVPLPKKTHISGLIRDNNKDEEFE